MLMERVAPMRVQAIPEDLVTQLAEAVCRIAHSYERSGRPHDAVQLLESALAFGEQDQHPRDRALLMATLGGIIWKRGCFAQAFALLQKARRLAMAADYKPALACALYHLGELAYVRFFLMQEGGLEDAFDYHECCLVLRQEMADLPGITLSLSRLGALHEWLRDYDRALAYHQQAVQLALEIDYAPGLVRPYMHMGGSHRRKGNLRTALAFYQKALDISQEAGIQEDVVFGLLNVGLAEYRLARDPKVAEECFRRALGMAEQLDFKMAVGRACRELADLYASERDGRRAVRYLDRLVRLADETGYRLFSKWAQRRIEEIRGNQECPDSVVVSSKEG
jgi:tetratricopeptide (TPR) repeat protein